MISFYDISSTLKDKAWSANTFKTRYTLNYKRLEYETVWVEYPDIESLCKEVGGKFTGLKSDGRPHFTLPMIKDDRTGAVVCDSFEIAKYLDDAYPSTPSVIPRGSEALQAMFAEVFSEHVSVLEPVLLPRTWKILNVASQDYFKATKPDASAKPEGDVECWKKAKVGFSKADQWLRHNGVETSSYVMGDTLTFADFVVVAFIAWIRKIFGEESGEWREFATWDEGRWAKLYKGLAKYEANPA